MNRKLFTYSAPLLLFTPYSLLAEDVEKEETVVVTAAGYEQDITQAPASMSVISREDLENGSYRDLTDALNDIPGVVISSGDESKDIVIRGMPGEYTAILVDGRKQSGRESIPNGSAGYEQDWLPPLQAIERIEVVRGPMSTLYGSDAIGGVVNIITRKDYQSWHGNLRAENTFQEDDDSGDASQKSVYLAGPVIKDLLSVSLAAMKQDRDEDNLDFGYSGKELTNYRGAINLTPNDTDTVSLDFTKQRQKRISTFGLSSPSSRNAGTRRNKRESTSLSHSGNYEWGSGSSYVQYESVENEGRDITIDNLALNSQWSMPVFDNHYLTIGASYEKEELEDNDSGETSLTDITVLENSQWSLFAEDEYALAEDFTLVVGLRLDQNELFDSHLSPRVYGIWNIDEHWTLKSGVSTGYRAPDLREMTKDWVQDSNGGDIFGNPDLTPETSVSKEIGLHYLGENHFNAGLTLFHNDFDDKIVRVTCPESICGVSSGRDYRYNINIDEAVTYGAEASVAFNISENISVNTSYTYTESEQKSGDDEGQPLTQIPEHLVSVNTNWQVTEDIRSWIRYNYRGKESIPTSVDDDQGDRAPSATYIDLGGSWQVIDNIKLMVGVYNALDKEISYDEYGYVEDGRRYWLAMDVNF